MGEQKTVLLIGCGRYAEAAHLPALASDRSRVRLVAVAELEEARADVEARLRRHDLGNVPILCIQRDQANVHSCLLDELGKHSIKLENVDGVIISTYNLSHAKYIEWSLRNEKATLVDKPLTVSCNCTTDVHQARAIWDDYCHLSSLAARRDLLFMLATQRRYQKCYELIASYLSLVSLSTKYPPTFVQCLTADGWWVAPYDYGIDRSYDPHESGGGKLVHTGYHLLDILPWLTRHCCSQGLGDPDTLRIRYADVVASMFRPVDSVSLQGNVLQCSGRNPERLGERSEINGALQITFRAYDGNVVCILQVGMLHEGLSLKKGMDELLKGSDEQARKGRRNVAASGRTKQEVLSLYQGPVAAVWMRRMAKLGREGTAIGGPDHLELLFGGNANYIEGSDRLVGGMGTYTEEDSAPTTQFLDALVSGTGGRAIRSPVHDHGIGIRLLSAAYESAALSHGSVQPVLPVRVEFRPEDWRMPPGASSYLRESMTELLEDLCSSFGGLVQTDD